MYNNQMAIFFSKEEPLKENKKHKNAVDRYRIEQKARDLIINVGAVETSLKF